MDYKGMPAMEQESEGLYRDSPIVIRSRSFQQPEWEAYKQTEEAMRVRRYNG